MCYFSLELDRILGDTQLEIIGKYTLCHILFSTVLFGFSMSEVKNSFLFNDCFMWSKFSLNWARLSKTCAIKTVYKIYSRARLSKKMNRKD